jgi:methyl-accepting chemotaxis protein-1 (serine sensor receptor)
MVQEMVHAEENDWTEVEKRKEFSKQLTAEYIDLWKKFMTSSMNKREKDMAKEWEEFAKMPRETRMKYAEALDARKLDLAEKYMEEWKPQFEKLKDQTDKLISLQQEIAESLMKEQEQSAETVFIVSLAFLFISIVFGVVITIVLSRAISRPVQKGLEFSKKIAEGDLTSRVDLKQKDELGMLADSLNKAADNLESLISNVIVSSQNLAQAVEQISSGNQNLSQRTSEQASSLEEVASTIEEATATINQNAENAERAKELMEDGAEKSKNGNIIAKDAVSAIVQMNESSKKVADIISVINDIAFQTNLLALNAAVEAARAGEQGRGFAVVAGEVRNLAQRSGSSAKEIESLIRETIERVEKGTDLVNKTGLALSEIAESAKTSTVIINEIAAASQEQRSGINQINTAITEMDNMTQQNASLVEETASASEEMSNQAQELLDLVQEFKIRETIKSDIYDKKHREVHLKAAESKKLIGIGTKRPGAVQANADSSANMREMMMKEGFEEF